MTLLTGSRNLKDNSIMGCRGFTFIELMLSIVILSTGIVLIYRSFFVSVDSLNHVAYRLKAIHLLNERITNIEREVRIRQQIPFGVQQDVQKETINGKDVHFQYTTDIKNVETLEKIFELNLTLSWPEGPRQITVSRMLYLTI